MATDQELRFAIEGQLALRKQILVDQGVIERLRADNDQLRSGNEELVAEREATRKVLEALQARVDRGTPGPGGRAGAQAEPELGELLQASFLRHPYGEGRDGGTPEQPEAGQR